MIRAYTPEEARAWADAHEAVGTTSRQHFAATLREYATMKEALEEIADHAADPHRCSCTVWGDCLDAIDSIARRFVKEGE